MNKVGVFDSDLTVFTTMKKTFTLRLFVVCTLLYITFFQIQNKD
jgi:hypothetical protein